MGAGRGGLAATLPSTGVGEANQERACCGEGRGGVGREVC